MKADTIEGLLKEYSQFLEEEKVDLLREEGGRLWRANNELKKEIAMGEKKVKELDELITRHKATLDLLAKPARTPIQKAEDLVGFYNKPEPAQECGCLDKAKLLNRLEDRIKKEQAHEKKHAMHKVYGQAGASRERARALINLLREINMNQFDRAPCKPEPTQGGTESEPEKKCIPTRPALGKKQVLRGLETLRGIFQNRAGVDPADVIQRFIREMENGGFDLPAASKPREEKREHTCRCSTANLVEQLRSRASVADGIDVTDLGADQLMSIRWNRPATVIAVRKEENRS